MPLIPIIQKISMIMTLLFWGSLAQALCLGLGCTCTVSATALSFGTYIPSSTLDSSNTISVACSALLLGGLSVSYELAFSTGNSGSYTTRTLQNGGHNLNYNIYTDAAHTIIWGDGTAGTSTVSDAYQLSLQSTTRGYTAYGSIPAGQSPFVGNYQDSILVTVTF